MGSEKSMRTPRPDGDWPRIAAPRIPSPHPKPLKFSTGCGRDLRMDIMTPICSCASGMAARKERKRFTMAGNFQTSSVIMVNSTSCGHRSLCRSARSLRRLMDWQGRYARLYPGDLQSCDCWWKRHTDQVEVDRRSSQCTSNSLLRAILRLLL